MKYFFASLLVIINLVSVQLFGQIVKGTIKGKVIDPEFGKIIGANVILMKTNFGAAVDTNGNYVIRNVPFGQYEIKCTYVGYPPRTDTILVSKDNPEVTLDFELTIPKIPIIIPDSLQQYHNLIATLDPSKILEINIDSVSKNFDYTYLTITNKTEYPIYLIEDQIIGFHSVDEVLRDSKGEIVNSNIVNISCDAFYPIELPKLENLIIVKPFSTIKFPPIEISNFRMIKSLKVKENYYLSIKYHMKDYRYLIPFVSVDSIDDYYANHAEEIYVLNRATRGIFYSTNAVKVTFSSW